MLHRWLKYSVLPKVYMYVNAGYFLFSFLSERGKKDKKKDKRVDGAKVIVFYKRESFL